MKRMLQSYSQSIGDTATIVPDGLSHLTKRHNIWGSLTDFRENNS